MVIYVTVGQNIKAIRKEKGITQKKLSELTGISEVTIRQYEAEKYKPKLEQVKKIAKALNTSPFNITQDLDRIRTDVSTYEYLSDVYGDEVAETIGKFLSLNDEGKDKVSDYIDDLIQSHKYEE